MEELEPFFRETWAEIDLDAIAHNVNVIRHHWERPLQVMAVVKANGYGHGAIPIAETALKAGASYLGVATLDEALQLRREGISAPILILGIMPAKYVHIAVTNNIAVTVHRADWIEEAEKYYQGNGTLTIHLKVDTGMGRLGARTNEELEQLITFISRCHWAYIEGIFTHFATADGENVSYFNKQYERFLNVLDWLKKCGVEPPLVHCGNTATGLRFPEKTFSMFRLGISMYGLAPSIEMKSYLPVELKEAFTLYSRLVHVKRLSPGESVGYGADYTAKDFEWVGTVPIGYADGWLRYHSSKNGHVLINGKLAPFVGRICMDQCMVKLSEPAPVGEKVTLIGKSAQQTISIDEVAHRLETINYEIPCMISERVPRVYVENGRVVRVDNRIY